MRQFICRNCQYNLHQCFSCGRLGSSDLQAGAQVFQCGNAGCGYFYHPDCVADNEVAATELKESIRAGEPFTCPLHLCFVCRQPEDKTDRNLHMAVCRRCPKAYHRRCLPGEIGFEGNFPRAWEGPWEGLYANRILIYCLEHEIDEFLGTPLRNHINFPGDELERAIVADISAGAGAGAPEITGWEDGDRPCRCTRISLICTRCLGTKQNC
ncbi:protein ENHANCED DOWNY MILDEW 2 isoform X1 [Spinacia oleracea]|uniref:Protein ENHANCED DOWNY MILDEW 2 isoform X1 n=1 Tax=Spinacia oleracea TaxID=3562 RepID=A0A9R0JX07_SPIOL|nr:protein ENHANCED DOWNY MILDEW 2-like isoform X1 [Spinacia oleracea]XP_056697281.1 protein ENHANCED DOWNY MILDEW 2-like isoform X1 [Spinacia oleracea]XP_056697282.1 protein ENHANCED DOWNY MILDEW 2-like isoform X1 [Spinacia oleracea]